MRRRDCRIWATWAVLGSVLTLWGQGACAGDLAVEGDEQTNLVTLALQSEVRGDASARTELLNKAIVESPDNAAARWHSGQVWHAEGWLRPEEVAARAASDRLLSDYRQRRDACPETVDDQLQLARWCAREGLVDQQRAHLTKVLELNSNHAEARRELGFRWVDGVWLSAEERRDSADRAQQAAEGLRTWTPKLIKMRDAVERRSLRQRQVAFDRLKEIADPAAIPALEAVFGMHSEQAALVLVEVLADFDGHEAATALARQAVFSPSEQVRANAATKLHARPYQQFVPVLLAAMYTPLESQLELYVTPAGRLMYRHAFYREGDDQQQLQVFETSYRSIGNNGSNNINDMARAQRFMLRMAQERQQQAAVQEANNVELTSRICRVLATATDQALPENAENWWNWWNDRNEISYSSEKPLEQRVSRTNITDLAGFTSPPAPPPHECLAAGTPIWTEGGPVAVEKIKVGDRVLAQDPDSGELNFKPVLRTTIRPSGPLLELNAGSGGSLRCSGGHCFWVAGKGWMRARTLEPGMTLHSLEGPVELESVREADAAETYNLIVADFHSYFVASGHWLSHDNTPQRPTNAVVPGLVAAR